jgi:hypothetical protein
MALFMGDGATVVRATQDACIRQFGADAFPPSTIPHSALSRSGPLSPLRAAEVDPSEAGGVAFPLGGSRPFRRWFRGL